eukprot:scaffold31844_cov64-Phaeocystis_antarctica.AAC.1
MLLQGRLVVPPRPPPLPARTLHRQGRGRLAHSRGAPRRRAAAYDPGGARTAARAASMVRTLWVGRARRAARRFLRLWRRHPAHRATALPARLVAVRRSSRPLCFGRAGRAFTCARLALCLVRSRVDPPAPSRLRRRLRRAAGIFPGNVHGRRWCRGARGDCAAPARAQVPPAARLTALDRAPPAQEQTGARRRWRLGGTVAGRAACAAATRVHAGTEWRSAPRVDAAEPQRGGQLSAAPRRTSQPMRTRSVWLNASIWFTFTSLSRLRFP